MSTLLLKRVSHSQRSGEWNDDDYLLRRFDGPLQCASIDAVIGHGRGVC